MKLPGMFAGHSKRFIENTSKDELLGGLVYYNKKIYSLILIIIT